MSKRPPFEPHLYADEIKTSCDYASDGTILWRWAGTHWQPFAEQEGETHAYHWLVKNSPEHISAANAQKAYAAAVRWCNPLPIPSAGPVILPVQNGYLHLIGEAFILKPHDRSLGIQHVLQCNYDPNAPEAIKFKRFLGRILPDAGVRSRVQEFAGYTFLTDTRYQRAQMWLGDGANGKGTLANMLQALHHKTAAVQLDNLEGFKLAGMVGASLVYCDEAPQRGIHEQVIKSLIAGESVQVDRKYRDPLTVRITAKWLVLANHFPAVSDQSGGFWRRWDIVPFNVVIPEGEREPLLAEHVIKNELAGVLNWAIGGLLQLLKRGAFDVNLPAPMKAVLHQAKTETNSVQAWFEISDCQLGSDATTPKARVYEEYRVWCHANGMAPVASTKFWKRLVEVVGVGKLLEDRIRASDGTHPRSCNIQLALALT